jgi:formate hydrogenlyase transcriptional activator
MLGGKDPAMAKQKSIKAFQDMDRPRLARLLDASAQLGPCRDLGSLGPTLFRELGATLPLQRCALWLGAPEEGLEVQEWAAELGADGVLLAVAPVPGWQEQTRNLQEPYWSLEEADLRSGPSPIIQALHAKGYPAWILLPLRTPDRLVGGLALASASPGAFAGQGPSYLVHVARFLASFALRILRQRQLDQLNQQLAAERDQQRLLLQITNELVEHREPRDLFQAISTSLRGHFPYDALTLMIVDEDSGESRIRFIDFPTGLGLLRENHTLTVQDGPSIRAMAQRRPMSYTQAELDSFPAPIPELFRGEGILSLGVVPLTSRSRVMGTLNFGSRQLDAFPEPVLALLSRVAAQVAIALDNAFAYQEIQVLRDQLKEEKLYLQEEIEKDFGMEIVGRSPSFQRVLRQVETVAPSDATVLILGETGTGKELVARAIHQLSPRKDNAFVQINCASIPMGLVESELFGHEKGAFTGAIAPKTGRLELAHQGTLFLDEIGDLPLELQPKLLRALQERSFERLGGTRTRKVDLRLVTATNRDLAAMVDERSFRADLFYRLNVFPITLPSLRQRKEDIPALVRYFTQRFAQRMHRPIEIIPTRAMEALIAWDWPGNIRELENFIERSVILSQGRELQVPVAELRGREAPAAEGSGALPSMEEAEREHILKALRESRGKVGGAAGAAAKLGMKRTTLQSRMLKLGIAGKD